MNIIETLAKELKQEEKYVEAAVKLIDEGNTIPFMARYRKEHTNAMDDQILRTLSERLTYLRNLDENREKVRAAITEAGAMTDEIALALDNASTLTEIDDIYRPYRPKRKTRASVAKAKGLDPLAEAILKQEKNSPSPLDLAKDYINEELGVPSAEEALQGAEDIIAETVSDDAELRKRLRYVCFMNAKIVSKGAKDDLGVYETYKDYSEPLNRVAGHRVLAMNRGEREDFLKVTVDFDRIRAMNIIYSVYVKNGSPCTDAVIAACDDAYDRLLFPSLEREMRSQLTDAASDSAIGVFSTNLRQLLMQPPLHGKIVLGLDPGYRMGCKCAVVDPVGKVLTTGVIFPVPEFKRVDEAKRKVKEWIKKYDVDVLAIGNGTASHETECFAADVIREIGGKVAYMVVSEAGASVYSASELAAKEFPEFDVNLRSAVSIARRLQDPLAELVKIDPQAIGVGQYQHDMPEKQLSEALDGVVEGCVNSVGVDLNTASVPLLKQVSGISSAIAQNIVSYREENGAFTSRAQLKKVPKLGPKAFEQCAGFLRITNAKNFLDRTAVHPESYEAAEKLLSLCGYTDKDLLTGGVGELSARIEEKGLSKLANEIGVGEPTLRDIVSELQKPGRDPRDDLPAPMLRTDVLGIESLVPGMELTGTVRNVIDFGTFVDIGVHQDGLIHVSRMTRRVNHPSELLKVGDIIKVWVLTVDVGRKRIGLTMRPPKKQG